jgi:hypoxanthine phosphoribosyltransferase
VDDKRLQALYSADQIAERVRGLAEQINRDYAGGPLLAVCVLKGAFIFFADLIRHLTMGLTIDFVRIASYGDKAASSGTVSFSKDVECPVHGKDVLLVEDVVDTGITMNFLAGQMRDKGAKSLRIAALIDKYERREVEVQVDYAGFTLPSGFVVGYGLDFAECFRELPGVYIFDPKK